jgi:hypothetical protein
MSRATCNRSSRLIRNGTIITPQQLAAMALPSAAPPLVSGSALIFPAPVEVISAFDGPGTTLSSRVATLPLAENAGHAMLLTLQRKSVVLHFILPLSNARVRHYIADCIAGTEIRVVMALEHTTRFAVLQVASRFGEQGEFDDLPYSTSPCADECEAHMAFAQELLSLSASPPWALQKPVRHVLVVHVGEAGNRNAGMSISH